jgi:hypothetical protein
MSPVAEAAYPVNFFIVASVSALQAGSENATPKLLSRDPGVPRNCDFLKDD